MKRQSFIKNLRTTLGNRYEVTVIKEKDTKPEYHTHDVVVVTHKLCNSIVYIGTIVCEQDNSIFLIENVTINPSRTFNEKITTILKLAYQAF